MLPLRSVDPERRHPEESATKCSNAPASIDVYAVRWQPAVMQIHALERLLSADEQARADRFRFDEDRRRYVLGRGMLRTLAAERLHRDPADVCVELGSHGKPQVPAAGPDWGVNVSHSGDWVVCAAGPCAALGVDVEQRTKLDALELADSVFSGWERQHLAQYPPVAREALFFRIWSMKEAVIKADGAGVSFGLDRFDVEFRPGVDPGVWRVQNDDAALWHVATHSLAGHAVAVAWRHARRFPVRWHVQARGSALLVPLAGVRE